MSKTKKAFTLAEVLITLAVIGIVSVILMGIIAQIIPSQEKVMLKKAYMNLEQITDALVNNIDYYGGDSTWPDSGKAPGDLSYYTGYSSMSAKFCTLAESMLDTKEGTCKNNKFTTSDGVVWQFSDSSSVITCNLDVNGSKSGGTYTATISNLGVVTLDTAAKDILKNQYQNN